MKRTTQLAFLLLLLPGLAIGAQFYKEKPYTEWSEKDAKKLLSNSPWAYTYTFTEIPERFTDIGRNTAGETELKVNFRIRWLSAKPVRQAIARLAMTQKHAEPNAALAEKLDQFVNRAFPEHIVIAVDFDSNDGRLQGAVLQVMNNLLASQLHNNTYLVKNNGEKVWLTDYQRPRGDGIGAQFVFPRMLNDKPFVTSADKEVRFVTELSSRYSLNIRFKVADMVYHGQLEY